MYTSPERRPHGPEFLLRLVRHGDDLLGALPEQHPLRGERHPVASPHEELLPQLLLQIPDLPGQRGLGEMQIIRRAGDGFLPGDRQKIAEHPQFHENHHPSFLS